MKKHSSLKLAFLFGTRPEIIKTTPIIKQAQKQNISFFLIHSNQHYDPNMDAIFFEQLGLPTPLYNLRAGSGSHAQVVAHIIKKLEPILIQQQPTHLFIHGDTNTTLAGALTAAKLPGIKLAHIEAGLRSYDRTMPEEINRIIADHVSDFLFAPAQKQEKNLLQENISPDSIFVTGNTIVDAIKLFSKTPPDYPQDLRSLTQNPYILLTLHRPSNVDDPQVFQGILNAIDHICQKNNLTTIYPIHPRAKKNLLQFKINLPSTVKLIDPIGYFQMIHLLNDATYIFTDSGGIQEEACILKKKTLILRTNTERPETLTTKAAFLSPNLDQTSIISVFNKLKATKPVWYNPFGDGKSSQKILAIIKRSHEQQ